VNEVTAGTELEDVEQVASKSSDPSWSVSKVLALLLGAPLVAFSVGTVLITRLPVGDQRAFAWGLHLMVPIWITLGCTLPLMRSGRGALAGCLAVSAACGLVLWLGGP